MKLYLVILVQGSDKEIFLFDGLVHKESISCLPSQLKIKVLKMVPEQ